MLCLKGNVKVAKYLLDNGADEYLSNCDKKEMIEHVKYLRVVQKIQAKESDINYEKPVWISQ